MLAAICATARRSFIAGGRAANVSVVAAFQPKFGYTVSRAPVFSSGGTQTPESLARIFMSTSAPDDVDPNAALFSLMHVGDELWALGRSHKCFVGLEAAAAQQRMFVPHEG